MRGLLTGDWFEHHGEIYDVPRIKQCPVPATPIPIIVGGHAEPALRRAARNDGWIHGGGDLEALPGLIARLHELRAEEGRASDPFEIHVISMDAYTPDGIRRLEELGRHRRDRRLPLDLRQGPGHRDPADQGRPPQPLRRHHVLTALCALSTAWR